MDFDQNADYLDLDDILAQTQSLDCKLLLDVPGLEFLNPDKGESKQGLRMIIPYWLAQTLYAQSMIDIELPKNYNLKFRGKLDADPTVVDLHKAGPYYYRFGKLLLELKRICGNDLPEYNPDGSRNKFARKEGEQLAESRDIAISLIKTFHERRHKLIETSINAAANHNHASVRQLESRLDNMEKRLFVMGRQQVEELKNWNSRAIELVTKTAIAEKLSKKKRRLNN